MSSTKLSAWLDGILEASWLAAIIVTPLFFNIYSSRVFEPDKLTTLRTIALVMASVWLIRLVDELATRAKDNKEAGKPLLSFTWRTPLVLVTLFTALVYIISTVFSVNPLISFIGSYQRLQGTFTTLAYMVVFFVILDRMRTRAQVDRLITTLIVNSLPIALYGFVQHSRLDPLPWGGDVTRRVASNMGNAIFVAAYLIMAVFPTLSRVVDSFRSILKDEDTGTADVLRAAMYIFILLVQIIAIYYTKSRGPLMGLIFGMGSFVFLGLIILQRNILKDSGPSRHPGLRWLWLGTLVVTVALAVLFFSINPGGPLHEQALANPAIGRLANVLNPDSGTGKVRSLIWEGALEMVLPHEPIEYPPVITNPEWRPDPFNSLRAVIGYGPESMYVAYNRFYPPLLAQYESRTASPDRSHNETFDSLIITGLSGFAAYLWLFVGVFYLGLRWLGVLNERWQRILFSALLLLGAVGFVLWVNMAYGAFFIGLAIPMGLTVGLLAYLIVYGVYSSWRLLPEQASHPHSVLLLGLLSSVVAHFVEINFGIAIASTRTTFFALAGVFVLLGLQLIVEREEVEEELPAKPAKAPHRSRRKRSRRPTPTPSNGLSFPKWLWPALGASLIGSLILGTLAYDFVNNVEGLDNAASIVWRSLTVIAIPANQDPRSSLGIMMVFAMAWMGMGVLEVAQMVKRGAFQKGRREEIAAFVVVSAISLGVGGVFALILAERHASIIGMRVDAAANAQQMANMYLDMANRVAGQMGVYYGFLGFVILLGGAALTGERVIPKKWMSPVTALPLVAMCFAWAARGLVSGLGQDGVYLSFTTTPWTILNPQGLAISFVIGIIAAGIVGLMAYLSSADFSRSIRSLKWGWILILVAAAFSFVTPYIAYSYNLAPIQADIVYKQADLFDRQRHWSMAVAHYQVATSMVPWEDFYYLYLGRALLENASALEDVNQQGMILRTTEQVLLQAQDINPLNTDHSANLARMYSRWSQLPAGQEIGQHLADTSAAYYEVATSLSPSNTILWNERALLSYHSLEDEDGYQFAIERSMELDPLFENTWLIAGDVMANQGDLEGAAEAYATALEIRPRQPRVWNVLGQVYFQLGNYREAIEALTQYVEYAPNASDIWDAHRLTAIAYYELGELEQAMFEAQMALQTAPEEYVPVVQELIQQMQQITTEGDSP